MSNLNYAKSTMSSKGLGEGTILSINVAKGKEVVLTTPMNHILVYDRSLSMGGELEALTEDIFTAVQSIPDEDLVTIYWYSGSRQFECIVDSQPAHTKSLKDILNSNSSPIGLTVFSEVLIDIAKRVKSIAGEYSISFFTDGYIVGDTKSNVTAAISELSKCANVLGFNTIGYGNYYDKDLLLSMTSSFVLGSFNPSSEVTDFSKLFEIFKSEIKSGEKVGVSINTTKSAEGYILTTTGTKTCQLPMDLNIMPRGGVRVYIPEDAGEFSVSESGNEPTVKSKKLTDISREKYLYGIAAELFITNNRMEAQDIAEFDLHDGKFLAELGKAFTIREIGDSYKELKKFYTKKALRELDSMGNVNYNKPALFDFLNDLKVAAAKIDIVKSIKDGYTKISRSQVDEAGLFKFVPDRSEQLPLVGSHNIEFSGSSFNVSVGNVVYTGTSKDINCNVIRKFNIINDGALNVNVLSVIFDNAMDASRFMSRYSFGTNVISPTEVEFDLEQMPIVNREFARTYEYVRDIYDPIMTKVTSAMEAKILNYFKKNMKVASVTRAVKEETGLSKADITDANLKYYSGFGLCYGGFKAPKVSEENCDIVYKREIEFNLKGFTTIPKVEEIIDYKPSGSRVSKVKAKMNQIYVELNALCISETKFDLGKTGSKKVLDFIDSQLVKIKRKNPDLLNQIKFVKGTTSSLFKDLELPDNLDKVSYEVEVNGNTILVKTSYKKTYISAPKGGSKTGVDNALVEKVKEVIVEQLECSINEVTMTAKFIDDLGADSLDAVELLMAFEEEFDIEIPDEDTDKIATAQDVVNYLTSNK